MIENGSCIVWVGSGLSQIAEYPDWKETIRKLCDKCSVTLLSESDEESASELPPPIRTATSRYIGFYRTNVERVLCSCSVSYTHLRAHETRHDLVCRLL